MAQEATSRGRTSSLRRVLMRELKHRFETGLGEDLVWAQRESRLKEVNWVCLLEVQVKQVGGVPGRVHRLGVRSVYIGW